MVKNPPANVGDTGSIPGSGRSPGERNGARGLISICGPELDPTCYNEELARVWQPQ